jgi:hypothetical protein
VFLSVGAANAFRKNTVEGSWVQGEGSPSSNFEIEMHKTNY